MPKKKDSDKTSNITLRLNSRTARLVELMREQGGDPSSEAFIIRVLKEHIGNDDLGVLANELEYLVKNENGLPADK